MDSVRVYLLILALPPFQYLLDVSASGGSPQELEALLDGPLTGYEPSPPSSAGEGDANNDDSSGKLVRSACEDPGMRGKEIMKLVAAGHYRDAQILLEGGWGAESGLSASVCEGDFPNNANIGMTALHFAVRDGAPLAFVKYVFCSIALPFFSCL